MHDDFLPHAVTVNTQHNSNLLPNDMHQANGEKTFGKLGEGNNGSNELGTTQTPSL
jgi:hypothetical protein